MIVFKLLSFNFMCDNKTLNWETKTLTVNSNIDFLYLNLTYYPEQNYKSNINSNIDSTIDSTIKSKLFIKKYKILNELSLISKCNTFIEYWKDTIKEYNKAFNIEFDKLILNTDYSLAPLYITENTIYIGIILLNTKIINTNNINLQSYNFLSEIKPYQCKNKLNLNKYNFINGILNKKSNKNKHKINNNNNNDNDKQFVLDTQKKIPLHTILQNSINYIPNLEIIRVKKNFQNLLNP
jgi:hypothetical protein